jgi:hypothetical protein
MNTPDPPPVHRPLPTKLRAYEAVYWLNRSFEATLLSLERLEHLGMFRLEFLNECKIQVERTRAEVNEDLMDSLHEYESDDSARFSQMGRAWEETRIDPDDVFFKANDRKEEIKEQIKELQRGLARQKRRPKSRK